MAGIAFCSQVLVPQTELGFAIMVELCVLEAAVVVAALAFGAEITLVTFSLVLFLMAGDAARIGLAVRDRYAMTGIAGDRLMLVLEFELGFAIVVESAVLEAALVVTAFAFGAEIALVTLVLVLLLVASDAARLRLGDVQGRNVAGSALGGLVFAPQLELGRAVVVEPVVLKAPLVMAALAFVPELTLVPFVLIILGMAGNALSRSGAANLVGATLVEVFILVATLALRLRVLFLQRKVCI